eukprot:m.109810 g.109810  ORF g.109810 m.109810 type:complete len:304 (+) comp9210_c2_seq2:219-1130(+)
MVHHHTARELIDFILLRLFDWFNHLHTFACPDNIGPPHTFSFIFFCFCCLFKTLDYFFKKKNSHQTHIQLYQTIMYTLYAVAFLAFVASAQACVGGGCSLNLQEIAGVDVLAEMNGCFQMAPNNTGYFFQLGGDVAYTDGVQFASCDDFGGCRCQNFDQCTIDANTEECTCFTPYSCEDQQGLFRCFELLPCEHTTTTYQVQINFNKPCVPTSTSTEDPMCSDKFLSILSISASSCLKSCQVNDVFVLSEESIIVEVRNAWDASVIQNCIDNQFVGAYDCFAVSTGPLSTTTPATSAPTTPSP